MEKEIQEHISNHPQNSIQNSIFSHIDILKIKDRKKRIPKLLSFCKSLITPKKINIDDFEKENFNFSNIRKRKNEEIGIIKTEPSLIHNEIFCNIHQHKKAKYTDNDGKGNCSKCALEKVKVGLKIQELSTTYELDFNSHDLNFHSPIFENIEISFTGISNKIKNSLFILKQEKNMFEQKILSQNHFIQSLLHKTFLGLWEIFSEYQNEIQILSKKYYEDNQSTQELIRTNLDYLKELNVKYCQERNILGINEKRPSKLENIHKCLLNIENKINYQNKPIINAFLNSFQDSFSKFNTKSIKFTIEMFDPSQKLSKVNDNNIEEINENILEYSPSKLNLKTKNISPVFISFENKEAFTQAKEEETKNSDEFDNFNIETPTKRPLSVRSQSETQWNLYFQKISKSQKQSHKKCFANQSYMNSSLKNNEQFSKLGNLFEEQFNST